MCSECKSVIYVWLKYLNVKLLAVLLIVLYVLHNMLVSISAVVNWVLPLNCFETVCKRWQTISLDMWLCQKHLDFTSLFSWSSGVCLNMTILVALLKRCGENLQSLDISYKVRHLNGSALRTVGEFKFVCIGFLFKLNFKLKLHAYETLLFPCKSN